MNYYGNYCSHLKCIGQGNYGKWTGWPDANTTKESDECSNYHSGTCLQESSDLRVTNHQNACKYIIIVRLCLGNETQIGDQRALRSIPNEL